jgi:ribose transport system ATP-binding protein
MSGVFNLHYVFELINNRFNNPHFRRKKMFSFCFFRNNSLQENSFWICVYPQLTLGKSAKNFKKQPITSQEKLLEVSGFGDGKKVRDVEFTLRRGEILGLAGLIGAGHNELLAQLFGITRASGKVVLANQEIHLHSPHEALRHGMVYLPNNMQGVFTNLSSKDNVLISIFERHSQGGMLNFAALEQAYLEALESVALKPSTQPLGVLSTGQQQKLLMARLLVAKPQIMLLDEPTKGVDVGAKLELYRLLQAFALAGVGVVLISSDFAELALLCSRVLVFRQGELVGELDASQDDISQEQILALAGGGRSRFTY